MPLVDLDGVVEIIEDKQKELCPIGRYGRNYVYGADREKYDELEELLDKIQSMNVLGAVPQWISVNDRLPSESDCVLVNVHYPETPSYLPDAENEVTMAYYTPYDNLFVTLDNEAYNGDLSRCDTKKHHYVSHWTPCPEPPRE